MKTIERKKAPEIKRRAANIGDALYSAGRIAARTSYILLPPAGYALTSDKLSSIPDFNFFKKIFAYIFHRSDINSLHQINDYFAKASGCSSGMFIGYLIDRITEKVTPLNKELRKIIQPAAYFTSANLANFLINKQNSLEELLKDSFSRTYDFFSNIQVTGNYDDMEYFTNSGIATLTTLALVKGLNNIARSEAGKISAHYIKGIGKEFYGMGRFMLKNTIGKIYDLALGEYNDRYETRRIANDLRKKAEKIKLEEFENLGRL